MSRSDTLSLLICGDICPTEDTRSIFDSGDPKKLLRNLAERVKDADVSVANLECVLSNDATAANKIGPVLSGRPEDAALLAAAGFNLVGTANNHIKDCGEAGVLDTIAACDAAGLRTTGSGRNAEAAAEPARFEVNGWTIGVMAVAEHEFNAASATEAGAHIFEPLTDLERLRTFSKSCDFTVLLYHGGIEHHAYPSPLLQKTCRALVRNGANLVLCQHSHVIGTFETYNDGTILYGQGNSVFGHRPNQPSWNEGLAVSVTLQDASPTNASIEFLPIGCDTTGHVDLLPDAAARSCIESLNERSKMAEDPTWIERSWAQFCKTKGKDHLPHVLGFGLWLTRFNRILNGKFVEALYNRKNCMVTMNVIRCAAHREVVLTALDRSLSTEKNNSLRP